ncbi:MAG: M23 family metallopeptidase [Acidobacteria bacterium]|nr:M23 family metallopeptidase [Acidobacteriota bacterium]
MNQPYFIVVLAHSLHGRIRRFQIDQKVVFAVLALALLGVFTLAGMVSSYARMAWKVDNYNDLRQETAILKERYQRLLNQAHQANEEVVRLQVFATEVSVAYGINNKPTGSFDSTLTELDTSTLVPTLGESLEAYNRLKTATLTSKVYSARRWLVNTTPCLWPVMGRMLSHFGSREDPFNGHQAFHSGVDISAPPGTNVKAAADGIVREAGWSGGYGKVVILDHGNGLQTYYAHLSRIDVLPGQEVRLGQTVGGVGATGRATSPHLHYEVRRGGAVVNPYGYLAKSAFTTANPARDFGF